LLPAPLSTQTLQRDRHAEFMSVLALIATSIEKFATEIRGLQKTETREVEEYFRKGQTGSSAMPHKRNPIASENMSGRSEERRVGKENRCQGYVRRQNKEKERVENEE